jgi:hypothetical protein
VFETLTLLRLRLVELECKSRLVAVFATIDESERMSMIPLLPVLIVLLVGIISALNSID